MLIKIKKYFENNISILNINTQDAVYYLSR